MRTYTISIVHDQDGVPVRIRRQQEQPDASGRSPTRGPGQLKAGETQEVIVRQVSQEDLCACLKRLHRLYLAPARGRQPRLKAGAVVRKARARFDDDGVDRHYPFTVPAWPPLESY